MTDLTAQFLREVTIRLDQLAGPNAAIDEAVRLMNDVCGR